MGKSDDIAFRRLLAVTVALCVICTPFHTIRQSFAEESQPVESVVVQEKPRDVIPAKHPSGVDQKTQRAITVGLKYLKKTQNGDGSWHSRGYSGNYPTAITSLAGLAMLASGSTPTEGPYAENINSALTYVLGNARRDGLIAATEETASCMHGHGFAMLFLAQCYGMEENPTRQAKIKAAIQHAVRLTGQSQSVGGGWLYTPDSRSDEGSVTVTQIQGLRAARNAGIAVPKKVIDRAMEYLSASTNPDGGIRYQLGNLGPSRPAITAAAVVCWYNAGQYDEPKAEKALEFSEKTLAPGDSPSGHQFYAQLYLSQAMYLKGDKKFKPYYEKMSRYLVKQQEPDGSWEGDYAGSVYGTAIGLIILQLPYKNLPIMQR